MANSPLVGCSSKRPMDTMEHEENPPPYDPEVEEEDRRHFANIIAALRGYR